MPLHIIMHVVKFHETKVGDSQCFLYLQQKLLARLYSLTDKTIKLNLRGFMQNSRVMNIVVASW